MDEGLSEAFVRASTEDRVRSLACCNPAGVGAAFFHAVVHLSGRNTARALKLLEWAPPEILTPSERGWYLRSLAVGHRLRSNWGEAAKTFLRAAKCRKGAERWTFALGAIDSLARAGKPAEAILLGRRLFRHLVVAEDRTGAGRACINIANAYLWRDDVDLSQKWYRRAIDLLEPDTAERAHAMLGLSSILIHAARQELSRELATEAHATYVARGDSVYASLCEMNLAVLDRLAGHPERSYDVLKRVEGTPGLAPFDRIRAAEFLADCMLDLGLWDQASHLYRRVIRSAHASALATANACFGLGVCASRQGRRGIANRWLVRARDHYESLGNQPWAARCVLESAVLSAHRASPKAIREVLTVLRTSRANREATQARLLLVEIGAEEAFSVRVTEPTLRWRIHALRACATSTPLPHYRRMLRDMVDARAKRSSPEGLAAFYRDKQPALEAYLGALLQHPIPSRVREAATVIATTRGAALVDEIQRGSSRAESPIYRTSSASSDSKPREARHSPELPAEVWATLGSELVIFNRQCGGVVNRPMAGLPRLLERWEFAIGMALATPTHRLDPIVAEMRRILGDIPNRLSPPPSLLSLPWTLLAGQPPVLCLHPSMGNKFDHLEPNSPGLILRGLGHDLPNLEAEVAEIRRNFPRAIVINLASEFRSLSASTSVDWIHACGHAEFSRNNPMLSALLFEDGPLRAWEIARSGCRTRFAVLSACETGRLGGGEYEPEGLVRAFLACGAQAIVASQWPLDDSFAWDFMKSLYQRLAERIQLDKATREAILYSRERWPLPQHWGAVAIFGGL